MMNDFALIDWLTLFSLIFILIGLVIHHYEIRRSNAQKRAEFLNKLYIQFSSPDILDIYYKLEYNRVASIKEESQEQKHLDQLLGFFDNIGHMYKTGNLKDKDLEYFAVEMISVYKNKVVDKYIKETQDYYKTKMDIFNEKILPFSDFKDLAGKLSKKYQNKSEKNSKK